MSRNLTLQTISDTLCFTKQAKKQWYNNFLIELNEETDNKIHPLFKKLIDEINSINDIAIKTGSHGNLGNEDYDEFSDLRRHTYLEFYALNHNYRLATALTTHLVSELEGKADYFTKIEFDEVVKSYSKPTWTYSTHGNGLIHITHKYILSFGNIKSYTTDSEDIIKECIRYVKEFKEIYNGTPQEIFYLESLDKISELDDTDKEFLLENPTIDTGILGLCNAINSFKSFVTMNSCQGRLDESEKENHCPLTYVDFYVTHHNYNIANALLVYLSSRMNGNIKTNVSFVNERYICDEDGEEIWDYSRTVIYRYRIDLTSYNGRSTMSIKEALDKTIMLIEEFKEKFAL